MLFLIVGDEHSWDKQIGSHIDYKSESLYEFKRVNERLKKLKEDNPKEDIGILCLGDIEHKGFSDREFRAEIHELLQERMDLTNGNSYTLCGDHDVATYGKTEYDYFTRIKLIKKSENLKIDGVNIYMVDRYVKPKDIIKKPNGELNVVLIHQQVQFKDTKMRYYGSEDVVILDDNKDFKGIDWIIAGHIHNPYRFKGTIIDKECEVIYPGCPTRIKTDENYDECSFIILDTKKKTIEEEKFKLKPYNEVFSEIKIELAKTRQKTVIQDILYELDNFEINSGDVKAIISKMKVDKKYKDKALEFIEKGVENGK